jgi:annexin A7/11
MSEEVEELEKAVSGKDENAFIDVTLKHSNEQRVKLREDYQSKYSKDLLKDIESNFKGDFKTVMTGLYQSPAEYDADLLYFAMKGIGCDKEVITEVLCFRSPERIQEIKTKFQEKYGKDLVAEIKDETSGDYKKIAIALLDGNRGENSSPDLENCTKIAKEIYEAGEGKIGTNEDVFIKYFTTLSPEELLLVCKEYHKNHKKNMLDTIDNEFNSHVRDLLKIILYSLYSPSEFYARQIYNSVAGLGTADNKLIRSIIARADIDMKKIIKYYDKIYKKNMIEDVKGDLSGSYQKIIVGLISK